ncbi:MurR/RpiR family transcriptional regulator [Listeria sp. FSL L7-1485]|uniref:MurR/RpiR family transcriptional regulator n=1 Tax=Listeria immobilis TaxID=2713502 RepID=A0A7X1CA31_9LIST|nr:MULTISPECIES: MurR/RpiR family transcriptional regulator [Listeria]MBC1483294.1 MurR/RpiR family transcriptional regulator [Listeria immobilis]MBC1489710.1 MurR/RpiR family transcriptional regulator [Listeria immobilis]MBC1505707.1 MurR/RpiR family transcriptional regulator [Listeria immobilis]MBC1508502.1 MurR/RpiR family transcriptional regulator [Listeria immobilis]MBC1537119.1 MurR/RpiR family transcriptional regulator [Listeria immobilis]
MILTKLADISLFSERETEVAHFILKNGNTACNMSIKELAKVTYSSPSTIMRLCKKVKTSGYSEFKIKLSRELAENEKISPTSNYNFPFTQEDSYETIIDNMYYIFKNSIREVKSEFNVEELHSIIDKMNQSSIIDIYGQGSSQAAAYEFKSKLIRLGKNVHLEPCYTEQIHQAINSDSTHMAVVISHSGENPETLKISYNLNKSQTPIVAITKDKATMLAKIADYAIYTGINEAKLLKGKMETFSSSIATQYILDCIYSFIYLKDFESNLENTKRNEIDLRKRFFE